MLKKTHAETLGDYIIENKTHLIKPTFQGGNGTGYLKNTFFAVRMAYLGAQSIEFIINPTHPHEEFLREHAKELEAILNMSITVTLDPNWLVNHWGNKKKREQRFPPCLVGR